MADYLVQEADGVSKFTLEDGSGAVLLEFEPGAFLYPQLERVARGVERGVVTGGR